MRRTRMRVSDKDSESTDTTAADQVISEETVPVPESPHQAYGLATPDPSNLQSSYDYDNNFGRPRRSLSTSKFNSLKPLVVRN